MTRKASRKKLVCSLLNLQWIISDVSERLHEETLLQVGRGTDGAVTPREAQIITIEQRGWFGQARDLAENGACDDEEDTVVAARIEKGAPVRLVGVIEHDVVAVGDDVVFVRRVDDDGGAWEDDEMPLVGAVLPHPPWIGRRAMKLADSKMRALVEQADRRARAQAAQARLVERLCRARNGVRR